jgi:hypothetical protein
MHEMYFLMFQAILVMLVVLALLQYTNNVATDLGFEKRFTSMDISLLTTAIYYAPGTLTHSYWPIDFLVPMDFIFADSAVDIMERGQELHVFYWFLSDMNIDALDDTVKLNAHRLPRELKAGEQPAADEFVLGSWFSSGGLALHRAQNITYYKTGRQVVFDKTKANPLQQVCPVVNTTDNMWETKRFFIAKVLPDAAGYSDSALHVNRLAQVISAKYPQFQLGLSLPATGSGSAVGAIPADASLVLIFGDAQAEREAGSFIVYIPVDGKVLAERKLACLLINDVLTPKADVFYAQIMPAYLDSLKPDSPLRVFKERSNPDQLLVFIDISKFANDQVDIDNTADAIYRAIARFYGIYDLPGVQGKTLSFKVQEQEQPQVEVPDFGGEGEAGEGEGADGAAGGQGQNILTEIDATKEGSSTDAGGVV